MSSSSKFKKFSVDSFRLVQKEDSHKKERTNSNHTLKSIARNSTMILEDEIDDADFFEYMEDKE